MATSTRGGTKDIGSALTRLCLRQRSVESHLKTFTTSIHDCLITPLQDRLEEWKKINAQLDKEHSKEYKKYRQELKKRPSESSLTGQGLILYKDGQKESIYQSQQSMATLKLKKLRLNSISSTNVQEPIYASMDLNDKLVHFEQQEKNAVRRALVEERSRFCIFVSYLKNVIEEELLITQETSHLQEVMQNLNQLTADPYILPASSELVITDIKLGNSSNQYGTLNDTLKNSSAIYASTQQLQQLKQAQQQQQSQVIYGHLMNQPPQLPTSQPGQPLHSATHLNNQLNHLNNQTPPSSPSSFSSRKSSCCSISSFNSSSSGSTHSPSSHLIGHHHHHHLNSNNRYNSQNGFTSNGLPARIPSIASHDSGFASNADSLSLHQVSSLSEHHSGTLNTRNWPSNADQTDQLNQLNAARPHTISAACYDKQTRPALSAETFEPIYDSKTLTHNTLKDMKHKNSLTLSDAISTTNNGHTTLIKVESKLSSYDNQQKFIEELDNVINNQPKANKFSNTISASSSKANSPPEPPQRKSSVISLQQDNQKSNEASVNDDTICSEGSIGSITPTNNPTHTDLNLYRLSNGPATTEQQNKSAVTARQSLTDELTATLTRQNNNRNNKLSTSCNNLIGSTLSTYHNNQLSLTNLNQPTTPKKSGPPPPPPIRRTSSISNPHAITLGTLIALKDAGISNYEDIKTLTRLKKNTTNYATYDDVSRLGQSVTNSYLNNNNNNSSNQQPSTHYATFTPANNQSDIYHSQYGINYNTYSGNRSHYRIGSCNSLISTSTQPNDKFYSEVTPDELDKNEDKEKVINQLRSEYQQAKNLFENLECNQAKSTTDIYSSSNLNNSIISSQTDFQTYLNQQQTLNLETDSGCSSNSNNGSTGGSQSSSSISGQLSGHISRMSTVRREFLETLNQKLSSPIKSSPKVKRRSLSIGNDTEYDYDLNESISSGKTISSNNDAKKTDAGHFSLQQSFMRLVQTNYAKITRSPELTRKYLSGNQQSTSNQTTMNSLLNSSYNSSLSNILFGSNSNTNNSSNNSNQNSNSVLAKEAASMAIKKKQNSYPISCGTYEVLSSFQQQQNQKQDPVYSTANLINNTMSTLNSEPVSNHTTTIKVDSIQKQQSSACQEIYQPAQNLQLKLNASNQQNSQNLTNQRRCSQPNMGLKVVGTNRQNLPPNQLNLNQNNSQYQQLNSNGSVEKKSFLQNADEKANFLSKLDAKLSPTKLSPSKQIKPKNEFENQVAARVETWLNKSSPEDETNSRENLLDQIRKGTQLRKVEKSNDRSAPKV